MKIKCRALHEDEMIYSDCPIGEFDFSFDDKGELCFSVWNDEKHKLTPDGDVTYSGWEYYTSDIMLCLPIKDKNGKDVYDGDIIKNTILNIWHRIRLDGKFKGDVVAHENICGDYGITDVLSLDMNFYEVIGNISNIQSLKDGCE